MCILTLPNFCCLFWTISSFFGGFSGVCHSCLLTKSRLDTAVSKDLARKAFDIMLAFSSISGAKAFVHYASIFSSILLRQKH